MRFRNRSTSVMPVTEAELAAATADLADAHHESLPAMREHAAELGASRRSFLIGAGALFGGVAPAGSGLGGSVAGVRSRARAA
ncbi:MAG: hypothetical protein U0W40_03775 [Acidimicrobiia bacterium]